MCLFAFTLFREWRGIATNRRICVVLSCKLTPLFHYSQVRPCVPSECQVVICLLCPVLHPDHMAADHVFCFRSMLKMTRSLSCSGVLHVLSGNISWSRKSYVVFSLLSSLRCHFWESKVPMYQVNLDVRALTKNFWIIQQQFQI